MTQLREEIDADLHPSPGHFADLKNERHCHALLCGSCGRTVYADDAGHDRYLRKIEFDADNQFVCDNCDEEIEAMSHNVS